MPKRQYDIPVLSGSAHIGQLYDGTKDQLIFDRFLWTNISTNEADITSVQTKTYIEETIRERTSSIGVTASLSVSLYSGLIEVRRSKSKDHTGCSIMK